MTFTPRLAIAVGLAGVLGTLANSIAVAASVPEAGFWGLFFSPGRLAVAILVAALLPVVERMIEGFAQRAVEAVVAIVLLTVIPSMLAKLVFGVGAPWSLVLVFNGVYAVVAWATYRTVMGLESGDRA